MRHYSDIHLERDDPAWNVGGGGNGNTLIACSMVVYTVFASILTDVRKSFSTQFGSLKMRCSSSYEKVLHIHTYSINEFISKGHSVSGREHLTPTHYSSSQHYYYLGIPAKICCRSLIKFASFMKSLFYCLQNATDFYPSRSLQIHFEMLPLGEN